MIIRAQLIKQPRSGRRETDQGTNMGSLIKVADQAGSEDIHRFSFLKAVLGKF